MRNCLLTDIFRHPPQAVRLSLADWDLLVRQARHAGLLARLGLLLEERGLADGIPSEARWHFQAARMETEAQARHVRWEIRLLSEALAPLGCPVVLLKGAAYVAGGLECARGRSFSDIDIMVPKAAIGDVERRLTVEGWVPAKAHRNAYDQRYYRRWMHELPPMQHVKRGTVLDVHHRILPETARLKPDPDRMFAEARLLTGFDNLYLLSGADLLLHAATHMFHEGEFRHGLRNLVDQWLLFDELLGDPVSWEELRARAEVLGLSRPLAYALRCLARMLDWRPEQVPESWVGANVPAGMVPLFRRALQPEHHSCRQWDRRLARGLLFVRSHYLRMPLHLLIPHLLYKALIHRE